MFRPFEAESPDIVRLVRECVTHIGMDNSCVRSGSTLFQALVGHFGGLADQSVVGGLILTARHRSHTGEELASL
jgi:hypothetical protein